MQKPKLSTIELIFVLIASSTIFAVTFQQLSTDGVLPGNDPAVHLLKSRKIVMDEGVSYSEIAWYPPVFHTIIAMLQIFAGTLDVMVAAFILKMLVSTLNLLLLLSTYLLARKFFGTGTAIASALFTIISVPLFEIISWGGYANYFGFAYIALIFYILTRDCELKTKTFLLFFVSFTIALSHQLSTFVFVIMFIPAFLASTIGSKKRLIAFLAMIVGGGLALLAWYARIIIDYADIIIENIFFSGAENVYHISSVTIDALNKNFGISLFLTVLGIPLTFILIKKKKSPKSSLLVIFWLAIPFIISQSFFFGIHLPYHRFIYFCAAPIAILAAVTVYNITQIPTIIKMKLVPKLPGKKEIMIVTTIGCLALMLSLFTLQGYLFLLRTGDYPRFYERGSISSYNSGIWVNRHSTADDTMVVPRSPGSWFYIFSDRHTIEETDPLYSRNVVAETVLYSFYEIENSRTLTREYALESPNSGQELGVSVFKIWKTALTIPNKHVRLIYTNSSGKADPIPLSETVENIYWAQKSAETTQLVSEYFHELFTVYKTVTFSSSSSVIEVEWKIEAHQDLPNAKLAISNVMEPSLDYREAFIPGVLEWQNPWDQPSDVEPDKKWAVVQGPAEILEENVVAVLDEKNGILTAFELGYSLEWFNVGALANHFIDTFRISYDLGNMNIGGSSKVTLSIIVCSFESNDVERLTTADFFEKYDPKTDLPVQQRDYLAFIDEYDIKFVVVDTEQRPSNKEASPVLDIVYNDGRTIVHTTKR